MEPRTRVDVYSARRRSRRRRPRDARAAAHADPIRPVRIAGTALLAGADGGARAGWLVLSALLHSAALAAAVLWLGRQETVSIDPIPIAWVRAETDDGDTIRSASTAAPHPEPPPVPRTVPKKRPAPVRDSASPPAPAPPLADATRSVPAEARAVATGESAPPPDVRGHGEPAGTSEVAAAGQDAAAPGDPAGSLDASGAEAGSRPEGATASGVDTGPVAGWMPRGGAQPAPAYPDAARRRGVEGTSQVALRLAANGRVEAVRLHRSAGDTRLDEAALAAVRRWRFDAPPPGASWSGLWFVVPIEFRLR